MTDITWQPVTVALADLTPWERNPKRISKTHAKRLLELWQRLGQFQTIAIGPSGEVYDGHQRLNVLKAVHGGKFQVQALQASRALSEKEREELTISAHTGTTGQFDWDALAGWDAAELQAWGFDAELLQDWNTGAAALATMLEAEGGTQNDDEQLELTRWDVPDALFSTDNDLGIPLLDANLQAQAVIAPVQPWGMGAGARSKTNPGMWHFYTEDYRFNALWVDPSPVINSGCVAVVEPNYSAFIEMPRVVALWSIYRKRWLARWWQSFGVRVFVDLNVAEPHYMDNLLGVPKGWRAWATRGYVDRMENTEIEFGLACEHAGTSDILFFVYGGGKAVKELCTQRGWVHVIEQRDAAKVVQNG